MQPTFQVDLHSEGGVIRVEGALTGWGHVGDGEDESPTLTHVSLDGWRLYQVEPQQRGCDWTDRTDGASTTICKERADKRYRVWGHLVVGLCEAHASEAGTKAVGENLVEVRSESR